MQRVRASEYHDIAKPSDPRVSPDGDRVAFVRRVPEDDESDDATVYVVPVGGGEPRQFTTGEGADSQPRWSPSGDRLAFVSTRGGNDDRPQLWILPTSGGEARRVTDVPGGVSNPEWSPDGERLLFTQSVTPAEREDGIDLELPDEEYEREPPDPRVIDRHIYRAGARYIDDARSHVYVLDTDTEDVERVTDGDFDHVSATWGDSSTVFFGVKRGAEPDDSMTFDVDAYDLDAGEAETVTEVTGWMPMLAATPETLAYTWTPLENASMRQSEIDVLDLETGDVETVTEDIDRTVSALGLAFRKDALYFATPDEGRVVLRRATDDGVETVLDTGGHIDGFSVSSDAVAFTQSEWDHPGDVFAATPGGAEEVRLTRLNNEYLDDRAVSEPEELWFENGEGDSTDPSAEPSHTNTGPSAEPGHTNTGPSAEPGHTKIQGWVLTPPDFDPDETYPLAVEIHGGPHAMWSTAGTMWHEFQTLAAAGYVVFWSNPRGSTGYGEAFATAIERDWGDVTMTDVMAGTREVASREYVDDENTFVTGGSFGGYMTGWIVGHTDYFDGAVAQRGVYDLSSFYGSTDAFKLVEGDFGTTPWEEPDFLWEQSPVAYADQVETPTLVVHADNDFRVPVNNGEMFYLFMKKNGVDTRLVRYPREGHELSRSGEPGHVVDRLERIVRWFDGYSAHSDAERALDRPANDGLSAGDEDDGTDDTDTEE
ncbi:S9 family peptidase [Salarchaeum sp. JOR-1]|uniref:S9 family peptidase n=1 Tax=Salarchaeum sp. JOR-1 TaxID=2599399 RepID=UPI001198314A|nr:S9 family peptidase [Salarchaeum sp. JOR-1]QDX40314.1 S9 family peptidase [Salarchaeum sp. JOR-1]